MEKATSEYLRLTPQMARRSLPEEKWLCMKEVCAILELVKHVKVAIQGGKTVLPSRFIFLYHKLCCILHEGEVEVIDWVKRKEGCVGGHDHYIEADKLDDDRRTVLKVFEKLTPRRVNSAEDVEVGIMFPDPS